MARKSSPPIPAWLAVALPLGLALAAAVLVHYSALGTFFAQDDVSFIARSRGIIPTPWSFARPLSEGWVWRSLVALFGLNPLPYHAFNFLLHLANTALVYAIGARLLGSRGAASAAAAMFGASGIAFTPLHWVSCLVELLVTTFSLAAFLVFLRAREATGSRATVLLWTSAVLVLAALVSKENAIFLPLAFAVAHWRLETPVATAKGKVAPPPRARFAPLVPVFATAGLYAVAFVATLKTVHYIGSEAYAMRFDPLHLLLNTATYLRWLVLPFVPMRDAFAGIDLHSGLAGSFVLMAATLILWAQRNATRHPEEVGAMWFAVFLLPVVPLASHTYLYYLYLPLPGAYWMVAAVGQRLLSSKALKRMAAARVVAFALVAAVVLVERGAARGRETAKLRTIPLDKTVRESLLLKNALTDLRRAGVAPGDTIAFMNPGEIRHMRVGADNPEGKVVHTYFPLEGVMRGGQTIDVFFPGSGYLGFARTIPPGWERARVFVFFDDGTLDPIGRGAEALASLGNKYMTMERWAEAESVFVRSRALSDTLPDAAYGLIATDFFLGRRERSMSRAAAFLRRWPNDARSPQLAVRLHEEESLMVATGK